MSVKIITDSISDISSSVAQEYDIEVLPVEMVIGDKRVSSKDMSNEEVISWIENNKKIPQFKGISCDNYVGAFGKYARQDMDIVCITAGGDVISNHNCAIFASTQFTNVDIHVVDTNRFSGNVGLLAVKAAKLARLHRSAREIASFCERNVSKARKITLIESYDFMKYAKKGSKSFTKVIEGGTTLSSGSFNAKLAAAINKDDGKDVEVAGNSMDKAINNFCKRIVKNLKDADPGTLLLTYTAADDDYVSEVYKRAAQLQYFDDIVLSQSTHFNTSFTGRNCLTATYQTK